jgi:hypothetical protein
MNGEHAPKVGLSAAKNFRRPAVSWTAAGSAAPRRFRTNEERCNLKTRRPPESKRCRTPLATAVHDAVRFIMASVMTRVTAWAAPGIFFTTIILDCHSPVRFHPPMIHGGGKLLAGAFNAFNHYPSLSHN